MSSDLRRPRSGPPSSERHPSVEEGWTRLRTLLLAPEQTQLNELRDRLDKQVIQPRDVGRVLPEAFAVRGERDPALSIALTPYVEHGFVAAVRKSPGPIVDAIAPIMGPAIRQALARALQSMMQAFNRSLDESLSVRGLRWRLEAWRTGRPFAEVVLLHTLRYRVEQVFLIHRETGLLLQHVAADAAVVRDQHVLSGMLTAIQQYVRDSFGATQDQTLDHLQVGEWTVWIEQGSHAYLASVIRGTPPTSLREDFRDALDHIHAQHADTLAHFDGNAAPLNTALPHLEKCLQAHYESPPRQRERVKIRILGGIILLVSAWSGWMIYHAHMQWTNLLEKLRAEPGIIVTTAKSTWNGYYLEGLRDPSARDPSAIVIETGLDPSAVTAIWSPYYALDPQLVSARAHLALQPPSTVKLTVEGDTLVAAGSASAEWATATGRLATFIPGISHYRDDGLVTTSISDLLTQINQTVVHFRSGSSVVEESELAVLSAVAAAIRQLEHAVFGSDQRVALEIRGSADETGPESINLRLSRARADAVRTILEGERLGTITTITTDTVFAGKLHPRRGNSADQRIVSLHARLIQAGQEISRP